MKLRIVKATKQHCKSLAKTLRQADRDEIKAVTGQSAYKGLMGSLNDSHEAYTALNGQGIPVLIFGVCRGHEIGVGHPWLLASENVQEHVREIFERTPLILNLLCSGFNYLINYVDARNKLHIKWIKKMGFSLGNAIPDFGAEKRPFIPFVKVL